MNSKKYDILHTKHSVMIGCSLIIFVVTLLTGCWGSSSKEAESKLVVINVLDPSYFQDCHIKGSVNIPFDQFEEKVKTLNKNNAYVVYCSNYACTAAPFAVQVMLDAGFANVALFPGGIVEWYQHKMPYDGPAQLQYLQEENQPLVEDAHDSLSVLTSEQLLEKLQAAKLA